jgi:hypothetical protein
VSYRLLFSLTGAKLDGLIPSTPCVVLNGDAQSKLPIVWAYLKLNAGLFDIYNASDVKLTTKAFTQGTLASTVAGATVISDDGSGKWRLATVIGDGTTFIFGGVSVASSARAAIVAPADVPVLYPSDVITLLPAASDGTSWFSIRHVFTVEAGVMTTAGAVPVGSTAFVEVQPNVWQVLTA